MMSLSANELGAIYLSLKIAAVAMIASLPFGILCAWLLSRKQFMGKALFDALIHLPLILPPVVIGYLLLVVMGRQGIVGFWLYETFGFSFSFNWKGAALASAVVAFPLMVRSIRISLDAVDEKIEQAARTLGASPLKVFFTITLPLTLPGILSGMILSFARSLGEFGATITFVSNIPNETQTIPLSMFAFIETPGAEANVARLCMISIGISLMALWLSGVLTKQMQKYLGK